MLEPDHQVATFIVATEPGASASHRLASIEIELNDDSAFPAAIFSTEVRAILEGSNYVYTEQLRHSNWGATGLFSQEVLVTIAEGVVASGLWAAVAALGEKAVGRRTRPAPPTPPQPFTAEAAWSIFSAHLATAFRVSNPVAEWIEQTPTGWRIRAKAQDYIFEGGITMDGRIRWSRRVDSTT